MAHLDWRCVEYTAGSCGNEGEVVEEHDLGTTGEVNARGWPISTGERDPQKPPRVVISGEYTRRANVAGLSGAIASLEGLRVHSAWVPAETSDLEWECVTDTGESCGGEHDDLVSLTDVKRALGLSGPA